MVLFWKFADIVYPTFCHSGAFKYHISQFWPFVTPPLSLNYHFRVTPPPQMISLYHSCCVVFQHIFMHFIIYIFFAKISILWVISFIVPPPPLPYHSIITLRAKLPPYWWVIWYLNAPLGKGRTLWLKYTPCIIFRNYWNGVINLKRINR